MLQLLLLWLDYYHLFFLLFIIGFLCFNCLQHKNTEQHSRVIIFYTGRERWNEENSRFKLICVRERLVYCWNLTGTQVTEFSLVRYPFRTWVITSPRSVAFTETRSKTSHQKRLCFFIHIKLLSNGMEIALGRGNHYTIE